MLLTLRILHILTGVFWAGTMFFIVSFLMPAIQDAGPQGGPVIQALGKRRLFVWMPVMAMLTILSGFALYGMRAMGGGSWAAGKEAQMLGIGGVAAVIAFIIGMVVTRPAMTRIDALSGQLAGMPTGAERDATMAELARLRKKSLMGSRGVATLLLITVITMAIAQYMV
jgi:uncharacterized membrane protein